MIDYKTEVEQRIRECREKRLPKLDLSLYQLSQVPPAVFTLTHLQILDLSRNQLRSLPESVTQLQNLQRLDLSANQLSSLPESVTQLQNLQRLDLRSNYLRSLPESVTQLQNLQILDLSANQLGGLPEPFNHMIQNLPEPSLSRNQLSSLLESVTQFQNLQRQDLRSNYLRSLPESVTQLQNLQILDLRSNQLSSLPQWVTQLQNLQRLDLRSNQLSSLPESVTQLQNLQILYLGSNQLSSLPESVTQLQNLQILDLSANQLSNLPESVMQLQNLTQLNLSDNRLSNLPEPVTQLQNLPELNLSSNQLVTLPESFSQLQNLQKLVLRFNRLRALPKSFTQLQHLRYLYLSENQLNRLPESFSQLRHLQIVDLNNNQLEYPPQEVAERGIAAINQYFQESTAQEDKLYELKLLLVGEGRVGKTSLMKSLLEPDYQLEDEQSTEGIDVKPWIIPKERFGTEKDVRLNIWDFGGQEIYHATHQFFLTKRSLYLLVTESRQEDKHEDFYYWLNIIQLLGDRSPILIVLNKCDQPTKQLPIGEYKQLFDTIVHSYALRISCHPDYKETIDALKAEIGRIITDKELLPHVGTRLPKVWVDVREALAQVRQMGKDYIPLNDYLALCQEYEMDEDRALFLGSYLHDIGVILHFQGDFDLHELVVLNHEWVTDGVYKVLDNQKVIDQQGRFDDSDLMQIWRDDKYKERRRELLALMKNRKFELCYDLPTGGYLAPQLLSVQEIKVKWPTDGNNLHFEYRYQFMPKGILTRFIVKQHQDIYEETHWRYGVLLRYDNTFALVRERYFARKMTIVLTGENKKGFLDIICKTLGEIHNDFNNLKAEEMIPCNCVECVKDTTPHFHRYELLKRCRRKGIQEVLCEKSLENVHVQSLIDDVVVDGYVERHMWDEPRIEQHYHVQGNVNQAGRDFVGRDSVGRDRTNFGDISDSTVKIDTDREEHG